MSYNRREVDIVKDLEKSRSTYAWNVGDLGMEDPGTIIPSNENFYRELTFDLDFPTGGWLGGGGKIRVQNHFFDNNIQYGYPPMVSVEMYSDVVADFEADIVAVDDWDLEHGICSGAYQTYGYWDDGGEASVYNAIIK